MIYTGLSQPPSVPKRLSGRCCLRVSSSPLHSLRPADRRRDRLGSTLAHSDAGLNGVVRMGDAQVALLDAGQDLSCEVAALTKLYSSELCELSIHDKHRPLHRQGRYPRPDTVSRKDPGAQRGHGQCHLPRFRQLGQRSGIGAGGNEEKHPRRRRWRGERRGIHRQFSMVRRSPIHHRIEYPLEWWLGYLAEAETSFPSDG